MPFEFIQDHLDFTDAVLSEPVIVGNTMTLQAEHVAIDPEHPQNSTGSYLAIRRATLVFSGVTLSKRTMQVQSRGDGGDVVFDEPRTLIDLGSEREVSAGRRVLYLEGPVSRGGPASRGSVEIDVADPWEIHCESASIDVDEGEREASPIICRELLVSYVELQSGLLNAFDAASRSRTGQLELESESWSWSRHGAGVRFECSRTGVTVDVHDEMDKPELFDPWRIAQYVEPRDEESIDFEAAMAAIERLMASGAVHELTPTGTTAGLRRFKLLD